jgi:uncharacterized SAM-dependent methyltransferase
MLKFKEKSPLPYSPEFFDRCTSLFFGFESGHMGSDMYYPHRGERSYRDSEGRRHMEPMSGVLTWDEHAKYGAIPRMSRQAFLSMIDELPASIGEGLPIVEYGPGSMEDANRLIEVMKSKIYIPADLSEGIIDQASELASTVEGCEVRPAIIDLFADKNTPLIKEPALAALLGLTITNLRGPVPQSEPRNGLIRAFRNLSKPIGHSGGYLLVSTHAEQDGDRNKSLYNEEWHKKFGVNFLFRMQAELPMDGFNPDYFEYLPIWHEHCGLIAHTIRATHDQNFVMGEFGEIKVFIKSGDVFHFNNSFKYKSSFFEDCANQAGFRTMGKWEDSNRMSVYLFEVSPVLELQLAPRLGTTLAQRTLMAS